ncbi:MAG: AEC family transporter [Spirochaetales bacterium]|nr:MAG: AEC family transporter [Spirochaetales bacterium]
MAGSILLGILELFILFGLGMAARKLKLITEETITGMSRIILDVLFPVLIFQSLVRDFDPRRLGELWPLPCAGFAVMLLGGAASFLLEKGLRTDEDSVRKTFRHLCAINNYTFLPVILLGRIMGDTGIAQLFFLNIGSTLGFWTIGIGLLGKTGSIKKLLRSLVTPSLVAIILSLSLSLTGVGGYIPDFILDVFKKAGTASVQIMLVLIGASWTGLSFRGDIWNQGYLAFVRLIFLPAVFSLILFLLRLPTDVFMVSLIAAIMPVSSQSPIITRRYGGSPDFASRAVIVTTLASAVTVPLWVMIFR